MNAFELNKKASQLRRDVVELFNEGVGGHLGGSASIADIIAALYYEVMRLDRDDPEWPQRDRLIMSKGHCVPIQYAALLDLGYLPESQRTEFKVLGSMLQGHPDRLKTAGIEAGTGSLGQGLSVACGIAAGLKSVGSDANVYCIMGDGELGEGSVWEAVMSAPVMKLDHLTAIADLNGLQANGRLKDMVDSGPYREKFEAFGWYVIEIDGHDMEQILPAFALARRVTGKPVMILAHTIKGKGFPFAEDNPSYHHAVLTRKEFEEAMRV